MEDNKSLLYPLLSFLSRRLHPTAAPAGAAVDSRQILRDYIVREINFLLWFSLIAITALLLKQLVRLFDLWRKGNRIPGPPCPSFYGHSNLFAEDSPQEALADLLYKSHEKYGSVVKLWLAPSQLLVSINDPVIIKEMLIKAEDKLPLTGRAYRLAFGPSSFFVSCFKKVKKQRQSLAAELNGKLLKKVNLVTERVLETVMQKICSISAKGSLDCQKASQQIAFAFLGATLFGDAFFAWSKANAYEDILMTIAKDACFWASYTVTPFWKRGYWKYQHLCTKLKNLTQDVVLQCRKNYRLSYNECLDKEVENSSVDPSSVGVMIPDYSYVKESTGCAYLREEPCGNLMGMMFHGCLTTAGLIGNILARLAMHPDIQNEIHLEITKVRKGSLTRSPADVNKMHFLLATVYESARLLPAAPLLQRCSLECDLKLKNGVTAPAGAILVAPVQLMQTDEFIWGSDASEFNPFRFLSKAEKVSECDSNSHIKGVSAGSSYVLSDLTENAAFVPFGYGVRACVGQKFAVLGVAAVIATLLEHYEVRLEPGSNIEPKASMANGVLQLLPSPKIVFVTRNT